MTKDHSFDPCPLLGNCHYQTIIASFFNFYPDTPSETRIVKLPDGDSIAVEVSTPVKWTPSDPTVVMVHGLGGSHKSAYLMRMTKKLYKKGVRAVRINMRGAGTGKGYAKKMYHSGSSHDIRVVLELLKKEAPTSQIALIGFSLSGNMVLKLAGELAEKGKKLLKEVIAINPPVDIRKTVRRIIQSDNKFYHKRFVKHLREDVDFRHTEFEELPPVSLPEEITIAEFDEIYMAAHSGYKSAQEYYVASSSIHYIDTIEVPCRILFAKDDPIIDHTLLDNRVLPEHVEVYKTEKGGHLGFLGSPRQKGGFHWMDSLLMKWLKRGFKEAA